MQYKEQGLTAKNLQDSTHPGANAVVEQEHISLDERLVSTVSYNKELEFELENLQAILYQSKGARFYSKTVDNIRLQILVNDNLVKHKVGIHIFAASVGRTPLASAVLDTIREVYTLECINMDSRYMIDLLLIGIIAEVINFSRSNGAQAIVGSFPCVGEVYEIIQRKQFFEQEGFLTDHAMGVFNVILKCS
ncbi:hypothetical protein BW716_05985 [[Flexibacter] sp. ATCC 35208]|nr:hypothetical protein BW716_05985 [[Flexibacter] sp. ATCC 35208]